MRKKEAENHAKQAQEAMEMHEMQNQAILAQQYEQQQALVQQHQLREQLQQNQQSRLNTQQRYDNQQLQTGLLGDPNNRAREYEVTNSNHNNNQQDRLAQTAPPSQLSHRDGTFEYDDLL